MIQNAHHNLGKKEIKVNSLIAILAFTICLLANNTRCYSQTTDIKKTGVIEIADQIYLIKKHGCNITLSTGKDGVIITDTGQHSKAPRLDSLIFSISNDTVRYILNTHFHYDHVKGNKYLAHNGAVVIAHENSRKRMMKKWDVPEIFDIKYPVIPPYHDDFLPTICIEDSLTIHFNNHTIKAIHLPNAHSDRDIVCHFRETNIIHAEDLFLSNGVPIIDIYHGGSIDGLINAITEILNLCNTETKIISGHGWVTNRKALSNYLKLLVNSKESIQTMIDENKSLEEVLEAKPVIKLLKGRKS